MKKVEFFKTKKETLQRLKESDKYALVGLGGTPKSPLVWGIADEQWFEENMLKEGFIKKRGKLGWEWSKLTK